MSPLSARSGAPHVPTRLPRLGKTQPFAPTSVKQLVPTGEGELADGFTAERKPFLCQLSITLINACGFTRPWGDPVAGAVPVEDPP